MLRSLTLVALSIVLMSTAAFPADLNPVPVATVTLANGVEVAVRLAYGSLVEDRTGRTYHSVCSYVLVVTPPAEWDLQTIVREPAANERGDMPSVADADLQRSWALMFMTPSGVMHFTVDPIALLGRNKIDIIANPDCYEPPTLYAFTPSTRLMSPNARSQAFP